jgi:hypothetical protein
MQHPQSRPYAGRAKMSSAIVFPSPTDLLTISAAAKTLPEDCSEATVRQWVDRGLLPSHINPQAVRRPGPGRPVTRWVSASELAALVAARKKGARAPGAAPTSRVQSDEVAGDQGAAEPEPGP